MSTAFAGVTEEGADGINSIATRILGERYHEQAEEIFHLLADIPQTYPTPEEWWATEPR